MSAESSSRRSDLMPPLWVVFLLFLCLSLWLLWRLQEIIVLLVVGYCIAYMIDPCLTWMEKRRIRRPIGVFTLGIVALLFLFLVIFTAVPVLLREYQKLVTHLPEYVQIFEERIWPDIQPYIPSWPLSVDDYREKFGDFSNMAPKIVAQVVSSVQAALLKGYSIGMTILNLLLLPFIVYYLAIDFAGLHQRALLLFPILRRERVRSFFLEINRYVSAFVLGQLLVCGILSGLYATGLAVIGVELWPLLALLSGFGNLIPYLGFLCGIILSSLMSLVSFGDFSHLLQVWVLFGVVQFLEGSFITPKIIGDSVGLSPLVIILAIVVGGSLFGLLGIFLAVPVAAALRVVLEYARRYVLCNLS